jgi:hypothetical protein
VPAATALRTVINPSQVVVPMKTKVHRMGHVIDKPCQAGNFESYFARSSWARKEALQCYLPTSSRLAKILARGFFILTPRRRSGERTVERGDPRQTHLLSPPSPPSDGGEGVDPVAAPPRCVQATGMRRNTVWDQLSAS